MVSISNTSSLYVNSPGEKTHAPGKTKIMTALRSLLEDKEFVSITTAEIARTAGVTEALIYKYFHDKRDLLHQVLAEYLGVMIARAETDVRGIKGALHQLRKLIWSHVNMYADNRVFARILLLEVRNYPDYFSSDAYQMVKHYTNFLLALIEKGVEEGSIRSDIPATAIRQVILGAIEHACLPGIIFNYAIQTDELSDQLCESIFNGIACPD
ncbi:MAG: TetR/AcrR family transcriptional regulator [Deltaproteobacteria bacterium]|nr:TetR/AcrR family transcriptional regulator [Deltaproteobacteria bacterium]